MQYSPVYHSHFADVLWQLRPWSRAIRDNVATPPCPNETTNVLTFLSDDNMSGFALVRQGKRDTELCSVFSLEKGRGDSIMTTATGLADTMGLDLTLNCFDGYLTGFYARYGFVETERVPNWTEGEPDVVYMRREAVQTTQEVYCHPRTTQTDQ